MYLDYIYMHQLASSVTSSGSLTWSCFYTITEKSYLKPTYWAPSCVHSFAVCLHQPIRWQCGARFPELSQSISSSSKLCLFRFWLSLLWGTQMVKLTTHTVSLSMHAYSPWPEATWNVVQDTKYIPEFLVSAESATGYNLTSFFLLVFTGKD